MPTTDVGGLVQTVTEAIVLMPEPTKGSGDSLDLSGLYSAASSWADQSTSASQALPSVTLYQSMDYNEGQAL